MGRVMRWLPLLVGLGLFALTASALLLAAGSSLGYDYRCYEGAARGIVDGRPIYDNAFAIHVGTCPGTYTYPPPFAVALTPMLLLGDAAPGVWCVAMAACFVAGTLLLPVRRGVRGAVLALGAVDWPLLYAVKIGQVGPILFLLFAIAWRSIARTEATRPAATRPEASPARRPGVQSEALAVGLAAGLGAVVKVQPGIVAVWALVSGRRRGFVAAILVVAAVTIVALPFTGLTSWFTYADLVRGLGGTFDTPHDFAPGTIAHMAGAGDSVAALVQVGAVALAVAGLLAAWRYASAELSFLATVVASQLLSAPLRDHYATLLLLPTAWLLQRGRSWAIAIPLLAWVSVLAFPTDDTTAAAQAASFAGSSWPAAATIPLTFFGCLAALLVEAFFERRRAPRAPHGASAMLGR